MSIATITFNDIDLVAGKFEVKVNVEDTSDGFASAAHVTSMFVSQAVSTPEFSEGAAAYGQARSWSLRNETPETVTLTLTDIDLEAGSFDLVMTENVDAIIEDSVTPAYLTACFVRDAMHSVEFRMAVTEFANSLIVGHPNATVNEPTLQPVNTDTTANQEAA